MLTASLNVTVRTVLAATPVWVSDGLTEFTRGGVVSAAAVVVKAQVRLAARWFPAMSVTAVMIVAVYVVPFARGADGVKVAVAPLTETVPVTPPLTVNDAAVTLAGATASLNVAVIAEPTATSVALFAGLVEFTAGGVVSAAAVVVKVQVRLAARWFPATSVTAVVIVAVYVVPFARGADGVKVAVAPLTETVPVTPPLTVNDAAVTLAGATASLNVAVIAEPTATPVALFAGLVELTVGGVVSAAAAVVKVQL